MTPWPAHRWQVVDAYSRDTQSVEIASAQVLASKTARAAVATRSGAGAVRTCSSCSSPPRLSFFVPCAPTRWDAEKWARQSPVATGPGGGSSCYQFATLGATHILLKSRDNFARSSGSSKTASRDVRVPVCADARVYARGEILLPLLPSHFIQCYEVVSGSRIGSKSVAAATGRRAVASAAPSRRNPPFSRNIIGGGYAGAVARSGDQGLFARAGRRNFWGSVRPAARSAWAIRPDLGLVDQARTNGGFVRVSACLTGHVGTAMLERPALGRRNAWFLAARRQLCRLTEGRGASIAAEAPLAPPFRAGLSPSSLAHAVFPILGRPCLIAGDPTVGFAQSWRRQMGSGARAGLRRASDRSKKREIRHWTTPHWGRGHGWSVDPRRIGAGSWKLWGAISHVN